MADETNVISAQLNNYTSRRVICRENGLMFYGPDYEGAGRGFQYDIVLPQPISISTKSVFSLYRSNNESQCRKMFDAYKEAIPYFTNVTNEYNTKFLQEICNIMRNNPSWSLTHAVVETNRIKLLEDPVVQAYINEVDENDLTPVMLAVNNKKLDLVKALISLGASLNILCEGSSVLHLAAAKDENILQYLLAINDSRQWLNSYNKFGLTPLHYACEANNTKCIDMLLKAGARFEKDGECFSSPLHSCISKTTMKQLINCNYDVNETDQSKSTPLLTMAKSANYECVMTLLSNGADPTLSDNNGNTPLHIAVRMGDLKTVKALIVFGADLNHVNNKGHTPRHYVNLQKPNSAKLLYALHAVGAKRCNSYFDDCTDACSSNGSNNGAFTPVQNDYPPPNPLQNILTVLGMEKASLEKRTIKGGRLLCLDGGGIRGLILIQILEEFQKLLGKPIIECFDWVSGTSVGGIMALALATNRSLSECRCLFFRLKDTVFQGERPYLSDDIENQLKTYFTDDALFSSIQNPKLIITSVKIDKYPLCLHIFRNYPSPADILHYGTSATSRIPRIPIWELARSTSAAPTYFNPFKDYLDGGLVANNPTLDAMTEILEYGLARRATGLSETADFATIVLSCGTGLIPNTEVDRSFFQTNWKNAGIFGKMTIIASRLKHIGNIITELVAGSDGRLIDRARAWCATAGIPYYRFNPPMSSSIPLDETSDEKLVDVLWETKEYMNKNMVLVKEVVDCLSRE